MKDEKTASTDARGCCGPQASREGEAGCPMMSMCSGLFGKGRSRLLRVLSGAALILFGVAVLARPQRGD